MEQRQLDATHVEPSPGEAPEEDARRSDESHPQVAPERKPLSAVGGFVVIPPVMFVLGLLLALLGQLVAGAIEVVAAIALFTGFYVWGRRHL